MKKISEAVFEALTKILKMGGIPYDHTHVNMGRKRRNSINLRLMRAMREDELIEQVWCRGEWMLFVTAAGCAAVNNERNRRMMAEVLS